jgi:hypothetical protein
MKRILIFFVLLLLLPAGMTVAAPVGWTDSDGNTHYYELINADVTWNQARSQANAMSYNGWQGHLATVTSAAENLFLTADLGGGETENLLHYHWIGGFQPSGSPEPGGGWSWVTGEPFAYNNWGGEKNDDGTITRWEPNNSFGTEDRIVYDGGFLPDGKCWNDLTGDPTWTTSGYIVEYDGLSDTAKIPEPATMLLLGLGLAGVAGMRRKPRK